MTDWIYERPNNRAVLKRRMIFAPLPETEPLLAKMQRALPKTKDLLPPCYYRRTLLEPEAPVRTGSPVVHPSGVEVDGGGPDCLRDAAASRSQSRPPRLAALVNHDEFFMFF